MQTIIDAQISDCQITLVVSNRKAAYGLERVEAASISTLYFPAKPYFESGKSREEYDYDLVLKLKEYEPDLFLKGV